MSLKLWPILLLVFSITWMQSSYASLVLSPNRAIFEGKARSMEIRLTNNSDKKASYRLMFKNMQMTEQGNLTEVDKAKVPGLYADKMIRFSPRQVTLEPGASQSVRLLVRKPKGLEDGEYRSHLLFQAVPDEAGIDLSDLIQPGEESIGVRVIPIFGVSIPVIVRQGKLNVEASLADLNFKAGTKETPPEVQMHIHRNGQRSVAGDLEITHYAPNAKQGVVVGLTQGTTVLAPTDKRRSIVQLNVPPQHQLKGGRLAVVYREPGESKGILAEAEIALP